MSICVICVLFDNQPQIPLEAEYLPLDVPTFKDFDAPFGGEAGRHARNIPKNTPLILSRGE